MLNKFKISAYFLTVYLFVFPTTNMLFSWHLFLKKTISIESSEVKLKDLGNIYSTTMPLNQRKQLLNSLVNYYPAKNEVLTLKKIKKMLEDNGLFPESIRGSEPEVTIPLTKIPGKDVEKIIHDQSMLSNPAEYNILVKNGLEIPEFLDYEIVIDKTMQPGQKTARVVFKNRNFSPIIIDYELQGKFLLYIAQKDIKAGTRLDKNSFLKKEVFSANNSNYRLKSDPTGYLLLKDMKEGSVIEPQNLKKIIDINPGDIVSLNYKSRNIDIKYSGKALQSGSIGEIIRFKINRKKYLFGEITGSNTATITERK